MPHHVAAVVQTERQFQVVQVGGEQPRQHRREIAAQHEQLTVPVDEAVELFQPAPLQQRPVRLEVVEDGQQHLAEAALLEQRGQTRLQPAAALHAVEESGRHSGRQAGGDLHRLAARGGSARATRAVRRPSGKARRGSIPGCIRPRSNDAGRDAWPLEPGWRVFAPHANQSERPSSGARMACRVTFAMGC